MTDLPPTREYSPAELAALRTVSSQEWNNPGDPAVRGPAQFAGGHYWPDFLQEKADVLERRAARYRIAAIALRREISTDPRCQPTEESTS